MKKYSLAYLISKQPKTLRKSKDFNYLITTFNSSETLKKLAINRKCYNLLNRARIAPENLENFYKTYRLPKVPFFPLFFKIKHEYIEKKNDLKIKKEKYIAEKIKKLPENSFRAIQYLAQIEITLNAKKLLPVWRSIIYPKTKKRADELYKLTKLQLTDLFYLFIDGLKKRYGIIDEKHCNKVISLFILDLPIKKHSKEEIKKQFRKLSFKHHPDTGGSAEEFNLIQKASKTLLK